jgi:hypothetical protein
LDGFKLDFHQKHMILTHGFLGLNATEVTLDGFKIDFEWTTIQFFLSKNLLRLALGRINWCLNGCQRDPF